VFASEARHAVKRRVSGAKVFEEIVMRKKEGSAQDFFDPKTFVCRIANGCQATGFKVWEVEFGLCYTQGEGM
jgi:hypothetical protein